MPDAELFLTVSLVGLTLFAFAVGISILAWTVLKISERRWIEGAPDSRLESRRWIVAAISVINVCWAVFTAGALAPAGALGWTFLHDSGNAWFWNAVGAIAVDGLLIGVAATVASFVVLRRGRRSTMFSAAVAGWNVLHHLVAVAVMATVIKDDYFIVAFLIAVVGLVVSVASGASVWIAWPRESALQPSSLESGVYSTPTPSATPW